MIGKKCTTSGKPPEPGYENSPAPAPINPKTGQHEAYWILCEEERKKGFVRPVRHSYTHVGLEGVNNGCKTSTHMGLSLCETYAREPRFYGSTFCCGCGVHLPVAEFVWDEDGSRVGS